LTKTFNWFWNWTYFVGGKKERLISIFIELHCFVISIYLFCTHEKTAL